MALCRTRVAERVPHRAGALSVCKVCQRGGPLSGKSALTDATRCQALVQRLAVCRTAVEHLAASAQDIPSSCATIARALEALEEDVAQLFLTSVANQFGMHAFPIDSTDTEAPATDSAGDFASDVNVLGNERRPVPRPTSPAVGATTGPLLTAPRGSSTQNVADQLFPMKVQLTSSVFEEARSGVKTQEAATRFVTVPESPVVLKLAEEVGASQEARSGVKTQEAATRFVTVPESPVVLKLAEEVGASQETLPEWATTLMIRNLPRGLSVRGLLARWVPDGSFDFVHVPYNTRLRTTNGVAFINFTSQRAATLFINKWNGQIFQSTCSKRLIISVADKQGRDASLANLKDRNTVPFARPDYIPAIFEGRKRLDFFKVLAALEDAIGSTPDTSVGSRSDHASSCSEDETVVH